MIETYTPQYVCFTKAKGEIFSIGPNQEEGYDYIEITEEQVKPFQESKENMFDWKVVFDKRKKKFELRKNIIENAVEFPFVELSNVRDEYHDVVFVVDKKQKTCYITTNNIEHNSDKDIRFTITKKGDPHILYKIVTFNFDEQKQIPFNIDSKYSVYSKNKFLDCAVKEII